jgi:hypothetical protein
MQTDQTELKVSIGAEAKKPFVEPEISEPVDVIESTSFFIVGSTGNPADVTD